MMKDVVLDVDVSVYVKLEQLAKSLGCSVDNLVGVFLESWVGLTSPRDAVGPVKVA